MGAPVIAFSRRSPRSRILANVACVALADTAAQSCRPPTLQPQQKTLYTCGLVYLQSLDFQATAQPCQVACSSPERSCRQASVGVEGKKRRLIDVLHLRDSIFRSRVGLFGSKLECACVRILRNPCPPQFFRDPS